MILPLDLYIFQILLSFLFDNQDKFFKISELENKIIPERKDLFNNNSSNSHSSQVKNYHNQFVSALNVFKICGLVEFREVPSVKIESLMVEEYQLSKFGKTIALLANAQDNDNGNSHLYDDIYQRWLAYFDDEPSSLDLFCKKYIQSCKELDLLNDFIKFFINYFFENHDIFSPTELFTQMIFFRFENDESKNEELLGLWKNAMVSLKGDDYNFFSNHVRTHLNKLVEKKVHDFAKFEGVRYENRDLYNVVIMELDCRICIHEYIYLPVPFDLYLTYFFHGKTYSQLSNYMSFSRCQKCKNNDFDFIVV